MYTTRLLTFDVHNAICSVGNIITTTNLDFFAKSHLNFTLKVY